MSTFSIEKIRTEKISDFYIIKNTGHMTFHRSYVRSKMDDSLLSGFLTAIFAISEELSIDKIKVMDMEGVKFIYENFSPYILILNVKKDVSMELGKAVLSKAMEYFEEIYENFDSKMKKDDNEIMHTLDSMDFASKIDNIVNNAILEEYFNTPLKIVEKIESYLVSLFGTMGKEVLESSIIKICKLRLHFKRENFEELTDNIEHSLGKKVSPSQSKTIIQQIRDTFLTNIKKE